MLRATSLLLLLAFVVPVIAADPSPTFTDPAEAGPDFLVQGEYVGIYKTEKGEAKCGAQVIALGDGKFRAVGYPGGLPGDGWNGRTKFVCEGEMADGTVRLVSEAGSVATITPGGFMKVFDPDGNKLGTSKKVERKSPTLGKKPPAGAIVLFDGTTAEHFEGGQMTDDGLLMEGDKSKRLFRSFTIHLEFCTPFKPFARGQARGNSGFYAQGRYETQILDSFGLEGLDNECGGIYKVARPEVNMCLPPLSWQTYDIDFVAAEFKDSQKVNNALLTVRHNGVLIHDQVEVPNTTRAACVPEEGPEPGPVYLQNHGNPVRFRNIWVLEKK